MGKLDDTRAFLAEGYEYVSHRCRALGSSAFRTRLLGIPAVCMQGKDAARLFFSSGNFSRIRWASVLRLVQNVETVPSPDVSAERRRREMMLALATAESARRLADELEVQWRISMVTWFKEGLVVLHHRLREVVCRAVCIWAGIPGADDALLRTGELAERIGIPEGFGAGAIRSLFFPSRTELWAREIILAARAKQLMLLPDSAIAVIAEHRDACGNLLDGDVAAREMLDVLRSLIGAVRDIVFAALALHEHPESRGVFREGDDAPTTAFVHEVRRYYPCFPLIAGHATRDLSYLGHRIDAGTLVLFDSYGTNHDAKLWPDPNSFRPARFMGHTPSPLGFAPEGGGALELDERAPREALAIALMTRAVCLLVSATDYEVPPQNLDVDLSRMSSLPATGFVMGGARTVE